MNSTSESRKPDVTRGPKGAPQPLRQLPEAVFTPQVNDGFGWLRIAEPQADARSACMVVVEYARLLEPGSNQRTVERAARSAVAELERGARSAAILDAYRVERTQLALATSAAS